MSNCPDTPPVGKLVFDCELEMELCNNYWTDLIDQGKPDKMEQVKIPKTESVEGGNWGNGGVNVFEKKKRIDIRNTCIEILSFILDNNN